MGPIHYKQRVLYSDTGNASTNADTHSITGLMHSTGDSSDRNHVVGTDGTAYVSQDFSIPENSTVRVTVPSTQNISSVRVCIPLEYLTSTGPYQSGNQAHYSNALSYQQTKLQISWLRWSCSTWRGLHRNLFVSRS